MTDNYNQSTAESQNLYTEDASGVYLPDGDIDNDFDVEASVEAIDKEEAEKEVLVQEESETEEEPETEEAETEEESESEETEEEPSEDQEEETPEEELVEELEEETSNDVTETDEESVDDNAESSGDAEAHPETESDGAESKPAEDESDIPKDVESEKSEEDSDVPDAAPALVIEPTETDEEQSERVLATQTLIQALEAYNKVLEGVDSLTPSMEVYLKAGFAHLDRKYGTNLVASTESATIKSVLDVTRKVVNRVGNEVWVLVQKIVEFIKDIYRTFVNDVDALQKENSRLLSVIQRLESYDGPIPTTRIKRPRAMSIGGKFQQMPTALKNACAYVVEDHTRDIVDVIDHIDEGVNLLIQKPENFDNNLINLGKKVAERITKGLGNHKEVYPGDVTFVPNSPKGDLKTQEVKDIIKAACIRIEIDKNAKADETKATINTEQADLIKCINELNECIKIMAKMDDASDKVANAAKNLGKSVKVLNQVAKETGNENSHELATITNLVRSIGVMLKLDRSSGVAYCFKTIKVYQAYYKHVISQYEEAAKKGK